jgi:hypothetical protein
LYYDHDKETPIPLDENLIQTEPLPFVNNTITIFVEWAAAEHGTDILGLVDALSFATLDSIRFHTFRSLVIVFGGNGQNPMDTDGDGSIGDPVRGSTTNREGIFDLAQGLYDTGWDVLAFDEEDVDASEDVPFTEAKNAAQRLVSPEFGGGLSVMGYSQGGGATHDLIERLTEEDENFITIYGVYLDAVDHDSLFAENDWPDVAFYLLSFYETNSSLNGGDVDDEEVLAGATLEEINTTTDSGWNHSLDHYLIDDNLQVHQRILLRLNQLLFR